MNQIGTTLISKSAFASRCGRSPAAVSHWIEKGILKHSLVMTDEGDELVRVPEADAEVAANLNPAQQFAQPNPLVAVTAENAEKIAAAIAPDANRRYLEAKATEKEIDVEAAQRKMRADTGRWIEAAQARRVWAREVAEVFVAHDAWMSDVAQSIAAEFTIDQKALTVLLRKKYREFRTHQAKALAAAVEVSPTTAVAAE
jgi:hypothetical protein